jgi:hypothetical protein
MLYLGSVATPPETRDFDIIAEDPRLRAWTPVPAFRGHVRAQCGEPLFAGGRPAAASSHVTLPDPVFARHIGVFGATFGGKSFFRLLVQIQCLKAGKSIVNSDLKLDDTDRLLAQAWQSGLPPSQALIVEPTDTEGIPGFNPFDADVPPAQAAGDFVSVLKAVYPDAILARSENLLISIGLIIAEHRLSVFEFVRALTSEPYLRALIGLPVKPDDPLAYAEAVDFVREFLTWSKTARIDATAAVLNKIREILRSRFLRALLCAKRSTVSLSRPFHEQVLIALRLDPAVLGDQAARLLGALFCTTLFRSALRFGTTASRQVMFAVDEVGFLERFAGPVLCDILSVARSMNLRLLLATQYVGQLSEPLRDALLANAGLLVSFRLGDYADARTVATALAAGAPPRLLRVTASPARSSGGLSSRAEVEHPILTAAGQPVQVPAALWQQLDARFLLGGDAVADVEGLARVGGLGPLYTRNPESGQAVRLSRYTAGLAPETYWVAGPAPLRLVASVPRVHLTHAERRNEAEAIRSWTRILQELSTQHSVMRVTGQNRGVVRVADVPRQVLTPAFEAYVAQSKQANGQTAGEIAAVMEERQAAVEQMAASTPRPSTPRRPRRSDDGSIA